ncbi:solute carrier family 35 member C2 isoform X2 [Ixodes scapularis]|uniref:solute carrier family 35 member C2 isoform X2 n=1 Tax=Ixodes scapularis TaxID=6945 RepID=UPI00116199AF|nr:solute carrier family 35 member C2 isoform X2 [Ixodes scapularis]
MSLGTSSASSSKCSSAKRYGCFGYRRLQGSRSVQPSRYRTYAVRYTAVALRTIGLIVLYYCFSIGITFYQKWFIKEFRFPLTVVICHLVVKFILSGVIRLVFQMCTGRPRILLTWSVYVKQLAITGVASALDIGFSNWSFEFITVSLYTMTKSTCIIFILGFSLVFGLEKRRCSLVFIVLLIALGLFMFTYQSTQFNTEGFFLVLSASFLAGLRWTLAQLVMQRKEVGLGNPIDMIFHVQPWMILGLLPLAIAFEGIPIATSEKVFRFHEVEMLVRTGQYVLAGSVLAFFMELSEYLLLTYTSSLTLSIAGIVKEVCTLYLAVNYSGDEISFMNFVGLVICLLGIALHVLVKSLNSNGLGVDSVMRVTCMLLPGSLLPLVTCRKRKTLHFTSIWSQSKIF